MSKPGLRRVFKVAPSRHDPWEKHMENFINFKTAQGLADRTIQDYLYHIQLFFSQFPNSLESDSVLRESVIQYFSESGKLAPDTFNTRRKNLKTFFLWLLKKGVISVDPLEGIKAKRTQGRIRDIPEDKLQELVTLPNRSTYTGIRDYALILLSLDTGIRPSEALALKAEDINLSNLSVLVRGEIAKTRTPRAMPISPETATAIRQLIFVRPEDWGDAPLFCACDGTQMLPNGWRLRLDVYKKELNIDISPYDLRHAFALMYLRQGGDPFTLQRLMGHSSMEMTKRYLALTHKDMEYAHQKATPLQRVLPRRRKRKIKK